MQLIKSDRSPRLLNPWFAMPSVFEDMDLWDNNSRDLNMWEDENKIYVQVAVPGMKDKDIDITLENGVLTVRATKEETDEKKDGAKKVYSSSMSSSYYYSTTLPSSAGQDVEANLEDGVLTVDINKAEESKPRKIAVKTKS